MVLPLLSFKSSNVISPSTAALVVVSRPAMGNQVANVNPTDIINSRGGYLDSDMPEIKSSQEEVTVEILEPAKKEPELQQEAKLTPPSDTAPLIIKQEAVPPQILQTVFTIQTGSFTYAPNAQEQFLSLINKLENEELSFLRIEKIGEFNAVRLGKFENYKIAEKFLNTVKPRISTAIIMKAYIKEQRTIQKFVE
ncbi:MAG: SPOR domain-containing protein [Nitrospirota bacterium]